MNAQSLYDLTPVAHVMLMGLVIALGPLAWLWVRAGRDTRFAERVAALTGLILFLTFDLVMFGAFTRLTDSGLGCPDWPGCYGSASPVGAHEQISLAQQALPSGPVTHTKAWIEMIHRYLATAVGVLIIVLVLSSWVLQRRERVRGRMAWPIATLVWVCVQGAFGALTVTQKLQPAIVTLHLLGGLVLLALLGVQVAREGGEPHNRSLAALEPGTRLLTVLVLGLVWAQAALGGWVSTNYAVLACSDFPRCQGNWWPDMDFVQGFEMWRDLGKTAAGEHIGFQALTAIHYTHRLVAYAVLAFLALLAWQLVQGGKRRFGLWVGGLAALQLATGLSNVVLGWPLAAAVMHTGGAAALVVLLTWVLRSDTTERVWVGSGRSGREGKA